MEAQEGTTRTVEERPYRAEDELFALRQRYCVEAIEEFDQVVRAGQFHEADAFEDYFRFDALEHGQGLSV